jgi:RHS repeat-associated protein
LRPTTLRYPSNTTINYVYGTSNSVDDKLNRFTAVKNGSTTVVEYTDTGIATPAKVKYSQPNLTLDYTVSSALDRFGRITDHTWKNASATALVRIKHGYDRIGNRLYREDIAATNAGKAFDELYSYDGMNQLIDMQRGTLGANKASIVSQYKNWEEQFTFDATGNFANYKQDTNGDGTFDVNQNRVHNKVNEITSIASSTSYIASDRNGNMTKIPKPDNWSAAYDLVYDAWNRLVTVKSGSTVVASYAYDGTNRRIKKVVGNETRLFYFNRQWQCLEEYVSSLYKARYFWGLRYIDDMALWETPTEQLYVLHDPNWNVVAVYGPIRQDVAERYVYNAFGKVSVFNVSFTALSTSQFAWTRTFTGQIYDAETGLMLYRNRVYHLTLGRFIQRDPIMYRASDPNAYRDTFNNPFIYVDPLGLMTNDHHWFPQSPKTQNKIKQMCKGFNIDDFTTTLSGHSNSKGTDHYFITHGNPRGKYDKLVNDILDNPNMDCCKFLNKMIELTHNVWADLARYNGTGIIPPLNMHPYGGGGATSLPGLTKDICNDPCRTPKPEPLPQTPGLPLWVPKNPANDIYQDIVVVVGIVVIVAGGAAIISGVGAAGTGGATGGGAATGAGSIIQFPSASGIAAAA